jgi:hypothetical protein
MTAIKRNDGREAAIVLVLCEIWTSATMIKAWMVMLPALTTVPTRN